MKCKFCGAEIPENRESCPSCGEVVQTKQNTKNVWMYIAIAACCAVAVLLAFVIWQGVTENADPETTTAATTAPTVATEAPLTAEELGVTIEGLVDIPLYSAEDAASIAAGDEVVAQLGEYTLTNSQLQVFYWVGFSEFVADVVEQGYDVKSAYDLDISRPLHEQYVLNSNLTWEQYFLHEALIVWWRYACVNTMADAAGYEVPAEDAASLAKVPVELESDAAESGFASADALIQDRMGVNCDLEDYVYYMNLTSRGDLYSAYFRENYQLTDEDIEAFFTLNEEYYSYSGITKESGKMAAVRHILLQPEGEENTTTGYINATDEQWEACRAAAQTLLDEWAAGEATETAFGKLANDHSVDGGSNTNGGLYPNVCLGQMVEPFENWVFDPVRKPGDTGLVKTDFGYHIMYFVSMSENDAWYEQASADAETYNYGFGVAFEAQMEATPLNPLLDKIVISDLAIPADTEEKAEEPTTSVETEPAETGN